MDYYPLMRSPSLSRVKTFKLLILVSLTLTSVSRAEEARYFRISGPVPATITAFTAHGYLTWTNVATNATFTVQTAQSLASPINWVDYVQVPVTNRVTTERLFDPSLPSGMVLIPAGSFVIGNAMDPHEGYSDELPLHTVYVSSFFMDRYDVTKALWDDVYAWAVAHGYSFDFGAQGKAANHPAQSVTWYDAVKWCNARSEREGRTPAYYTSAAQTAVYRNGSVDVANSSVRWNAAYRLPTEAEWEKAARGGSSGRRFPWSDVDTIQHSRANFDSCPTCYAYDVDPMEGFHPTFNDGVYPYTSPVGYFAANGYGLYDMAGNVWELCWDLYDVNWYGNAGALLGDTRGPVSSSRGFPFRVVRGGSWYGGPSGARCAGRESIYPAARCGLFGFRCVLGGGSAP